MTRFPARVVHDDILEILLSKTVSAHTIEYTHTHTCTRRWKLFLIVRTLYLEWSLTTFGGFKI